MEVTPAVPSFSALGTSLSSVKLVPVASPVHSPGTRSRAYGHSGVSGERKAPIAIQMDQRVDSSRRLKRSGRCCRQILDGLPRAVPRVEMKRLIIRGFQVDTTATDIVDFS